MSGKIAIVGAGLIGRLIACRLLAHDVSITLFDRDSYAGAQSCAAAGAGMLAPYSELELSEPPLFLLARESLDLWKSFLSQLSMPVFFQQEGTLIVAHPHDQALLDRLPERILKKLRQIDQGMEMPIEKAEASR
ncbi:MAG TPA: FAD-dependent oxidoreductase, partial [Chroococcales cyanobacterium]